ncbi:MAG TPA: hypothetical protein VF765_17715 [Polyangiaceae bacterium]
MTPGDERFSTGALTIDAVFAGPGSALVLKWRGKSTDRMASKLLGPFLGAALDRARTLGVPLEMHFEELDYLNSSTVTALIQLVQDARNKSVRLAIVFDSRVRWQRLTFDALKVFVTGDGAFELRATSN